MTDYASFILKTKPVHVGAVELDAQELTIAKRDAVLKVLLSGLDVATLVKPFWEAARKLGAGAEGVVDVVALAAQLKDAALRILGDDLTTVSCLALDTPSNRKKVAVLLSDPKVEQVEKEKNHGYTFSPLFFAWARENLTARQEYALMEAAVEINDFVGLAKNYLSLVTRTVKEAREKAEKK